MKDYKQKIISYKIVFYDEDDNEVDVPMPKEVWSEIDQAIYDWECEEIWLILPLEAPIPLNVVENPIQ